MSDQLPHDEELRSLYRKLPADEPRAEIDEAILSAAREVAEAEAREREAGLGAVPTDSAHDRHRRRFLGRPGWMIPLAAAASVILTVTLTRLTPEQPVVEPSGLRESSQARPAPAAQDLAQDSKPDLAKDSARKPAQELAKESEMVFAEESPAPVPAAPAAPATAQAKQERKKLEADSSAVARVQEEKKKADERRRHAASSLASPPEDKPGGAAPPDATGQAAMADTPLAAAPARPPVDALSSRDDTAAKRIPDRPEAFARSAPIEASQGERRSADAAATEWPFGLAPRMDANEACRRIESALKTTCRYTDDSAVVAPKEPVAIDRGEFAGRKATRVTLLAVAGRLAAVHLAVEGFTTEQILVAPPEP